MTTALVESIEMNFNDIDDPGKETINKYHIFIEILVIALCGANHCGQALQLIRAKEDWFRIFLTLSEGTPSLLNGNGKER